MEDVERFCFRCSEHCPLSSLNIPANVCEDCYRKTSSKIKSYNTEARKYGGNMSLHASEWLKKLQASGGYCYYCKENVGFSNLIIEHMTPLSWGGDNSIDNVVPSCVPCNSSKGDRDIKTWHSDIASRHLIERLQEHLGLSRFQTINLAIKQLAIREGLILEVEV